MGIFDSIKHAIFGDHGPLGSFNHDAPAASAAKPAIPMTQAPPSAASAPSAAPVDVDAILAQKAAAFGKPNNWRTSIVDLLTLLGMDSSLAARKTLADELNIHVGADGSPEENIALHKAVMQKLAAN
ncbi:MAG TPA: DUF3597 domain-containing protein, partial [Sphingomonas sp.]|nr:DUF3597 domain-containing protein [Sphingomonas sp.]